MFHAIRVAAGQRPANVSQPGPVENSRGAHWLLCLVLGLCLLSGCQTGPDQSQPILTHQPSYQPGLVAAIETYPLPDWAIETRNDHAMNPRPAISPFIDDLVLIRQSERLRTINGRPSESSHFHTEIRRFYFGIHGWE